MPVRRVRLLHSDTPNGLARQVEQGMSESTPDNDPRIAEIVASIRSLGIHERDKLFKALEDRPRLFEGTDYVIIPESIIDLLQAHLKRVLNMNLVDCL